MVIALILSSFYISGLSYLNAIYFVGPMFVLRNLYKLNSLRAVLLVIFIFCCGLYNFSHLKQLLIFSLGFLFLLIRGRDVNLPNFNILKIGFYCLFLMYFLECVYRINEGFDITIPDSQWFYPFKLKTFNGEDSNFVGFNLMCITMFLYTVRDRSKLYILSLAFLILTFSRTSILGFFIFVLLTTYKQYLIRLLMFFIPLFLIFAIDDYSFKTKILINYYTLIEFFGLDYGDILLGKGMANFDYSFEAWDDVVGHTIFNELLYGVGIVGFFISTMFFVILYKESTFRGRCYIVVAVVAGLSFFPILWANMGIFYILIESYGYIAPARNSKPIVHKSDGL